jgi:NAD(P)-dependent dehydrogenase (short-subunit alcohol dehydrogenase family)
MAKKPKAVVLGVGALRGIGGAASRRFAKEGYHVIVAGRTPAKIEAVVEAIRKDGGDATAFTIDGTKGGPGGPPVRPGDGRRRQRAGRPLSSSTWATTPRSTSAR